MIGFRRQKKSSRQAGSSDAKDVEEHQRWSNTVYPRVGRGRKGGGKGVGRDWKIMRTSFFVALVMFSTSKVMNCLIYPRVGRGWGGRG